MVTKTKISKVIIRDYEKLIREISEINGIIYHNKSICKIYLRENAKRDRKLGRNVFLGSHFMYRSPYDGKLLSGNFYNVGISNYQEKTEIIERKGTNYFVALAYEAFEKFVRSITARIIVNNKRRACEINERLGFSTYKSCVLHLQSQNRNNIEIVNLLRSLCPDFDASIRKEKGLRNFINFYRVFTKCRNHIIHSNDFIDIKLFEKPEKVDEKFAIRYFGIKKHRGNKYIIDLSDTYQETLQTTGSFAYLIMKSLDSSFVISKP